jgi:hypothetical protein
MWIILKYDIIIIKDFPHIDELKTFPQFQQYSNITYY